MNDSGEKTFAPTPKRRKDAARKGDVLRSKELATAVAVFVGAAWLKFQGPVLLTGLEQVAYVGLSWNREALEDLSVTRIVVPIIKAVLLPILTLACAVMTAAVFSQLAFAEGRFIGENLAPKASRLNPLSGLKRMFGPTGWIEMGKGLAKVGLLGTLAYFWASAQFGMMGELANGTLLVQLRHAWDAIISLLFVLTAGLTVIAFIDVPVQAWRRQKRLKMSHQEMRDEHKETEGAPEKKAAQRQRQRELAMGGVQAAMRDAQFVITNPTHYSVAMVYDPAKASAPMVLAKGRGEKAMAIRELAAEMNVPVLSYPALARSIYFTTRERQVVRQELYGAVASVLAFVLSLKRGEKPVVPLVYVPVEMRFDTTGRPDPQAST